MNEHSTLSYDFGAFHLDAAKRLLWLDGVVVPLMPKAYEVLFVLVRHHGQVISKDELMAEVWGQTAVEENNLNVAVSALRKAFGEKPHEHRFIVTVPGVGYQFVADVREVEDRSAALQTGAEQHGTEGAGRAGLAGDKNGAVHRSETTSHERDASRRFSRPFLLVASALVALVAIGFAWARWPNRWKVMPAAHMPFQSMRLTKLTSGKALRVAISPDGKQVVYVKEEGDGQSLWLRQTAIDSEVQLIAPKKIDYAQVVYARDGNFIYYATNGTLYEIPMLGGGPRKIAENVNSRFSLAHDGKRLAFFRNNEKQQEQYLIVMQTDGSEERRAATNKPPDFFWGFLGPIWSPDDSRLACHAGRVGENIGRFVALRMSDGERKELTPLEWELSFAGEWTSDGLIVSAQRRDEDDWQLWLINPTNGTTRRLTNDLSNYNSVSVTADGHSIAAIQSLTLMNIWLVPLSGSLNARQITSGANNYTDISVTPDSKLLYSNITSGLADIWELDLEGKTHRQLTRREGSNYSPVASSDGRYLIFHSDRSGTFYLYRSGVDGSNPQRLTSETDEEGSADISPDGKTVVFGMGPLKRVPIEGGTPVVLSGNCALMPVVSPDGKLVATWYPDRSTSDRIALFSIDQSGRPLKVFDVPSMEAFGDRIRWTKDGNALLYVKSHDGVSNIWKQPVDGSPPTQVTSFQTERIYSFALTPDGKYLACARGTAAQDVVLLSDIR